jgi:hypothetical protein
MGRFKARFHGAGRVPIAALLMAPVAIAPVVMALKSLTTPFAD